MHSAAHTPDPASARASGWPWRGRSALLQRWLLALAALAAAGLLLALVQTCQESMRNGERWHAEQRAAPRSAADSSTARHGLVPVAALQRNVARRSPG